MSGKGATPVALGLRAGRGGSVVVAVAAGPRMVRSVFLATAGEGDRLAFEPYHVAAEMAGAAGGAASPEVQAAVAEGRRRQAQRAAEGLAGMVETLRGEGFAPIAAALLVNRAGWITDLLSYSLGAPEHPAVAEGLAVRDALRAACAACGLAVVEVDEKSLPELGPARLRLSPAEAEAALAGLGASAGRPWRKEQKLACLAAWAAVAAP
jgi:hypothetical protein